MSRQAGPFTALGQSFAITGPDALLDLVDLLFAPLLAARPPEVIAEFAVSPTLTVVQDGATVLDAEGPGELLTGLVRAVNHHVITHAAEQRLVFHAAAAVADGAGILLPADRDAGKTTLVCGLVDRGWSYASDEAVAVDDDLTLEGYAKPLSLDRGSWAVLGHLEPRGDAARDGWFDVQWQLPPQRVGAVAPRAHLRAVVFPQYHATAATSMRPLDPGEAVERAIACTFVTGRQHMATAALRRLAGIVEQVPAYALVSGDLATACEAIDAVHRP